MIGARPDTGVVPVLLADGRPGVIRPLVAADEAALCELAVRSSEESLYRRFFSPGVYQAETYARRLCSEHDVSSRALVLEVQGTIVGVAAAEDLAPGTAEVAFLVEDALQGHGVGTLLLGNLVSAQRRRGITTFQAQVLGDNARMLRVFVDAGYCIVRHDEGGVATVEMKISVTDAAVDATDARERKAEMRSLRPLLAPKVVAVVGAGRSRGGIGREVLENIVSGDFNGRVVAVNPAVDKIGEVPCFSDLSSVPEQVDLAVVAVPVDALSGVIDDAGKAQVGAVVILSAGLAETGPGGREAQEELATRALSSGMRMVGPNCLGVLNTDPEVRLNATFACVDPAPGGLAVAAQSGGVAIALMDAARSTGLGISKLVSLGNKADVSGNDLISAWTDDPEVSAAALYLESFGNPVKFARLAARFSRVKPLLAVRSGTSEAGRAAGTSHTAGALTSSTGARALFTATGVIAVDDAGELADTARLLTSQPLPAGPRLAVVSNAGGLGILAADAAAREDLHLAIVPGTGNPTDLGAGATPEVVGTTAQAVLTSPDVDAALFVLVATRASDISDSLQQVATAIARTDRTRPVAMVAVGMKDRPNEVRGVPVYGSVDAAARALGHAVRYARWRATKPGVLPAANPAARDQALVIAHSVLTDHPQGGWLDVPAASSMLTAYGVPVVHSTVAGTPDAAVAAANRISGPVVLKTADPEEVHKTERGLVRTGLENEQEVRAAEEEMALAQGLSHTPVLVQAQVGAGVEIAVGMVRDPVFGPLVMIAAGGVTTDILDDHVFLLAPVTDADASRAVRSLRIWPQLAGYRGAPGCDVAALERVLQSVAQLAADVPPLAELDLNPVVVTPEGAICVDVKARLDGDSYPGTEAS